MDGTRIASVEEIPGHDSYLFTVAERDGSLEEVMLLRTDDGVTAWKNFCQHETDQRLDRGGEIGAVMRGGSVVCPRHGSTFDVVSGYCDNGDAKGSTLVSVEVSVEDGDVYLTDPACEFLYAGGIRDDGTDDDDDDDDMPSSTSHVRF